VCFGAIVFFSPAVFTTKSIDVIFGNIKRGQPENDHRNQHPVRGVVAVGA
jgi:hypothetical protein